MRVNHSALIVSDVEASLRFYRDGLGMDVLMDLEFEGDWPALFGADSARLHSIFLGDAEDPSSGIVELVVFGDGEVSAGGGERSARRVERRVPPQSGFFLLSFHVDVKATLERLGVPEEGRTTMAGPDGPVVMVTVRDPDGVLIELLDLA